MRIALLLLLGGLQATIGLAELQATPTAAVRAELEGICRRLQSGSNGYFSRDLAEQVRAELAGETDPARRAGFLGVLGRESMKLGQPQTAIDHLEDGLRIAEKTAIDDGLRASLQWHLALAYLQLAEDQNCLGGHDGSACLLPVRPGGEHRLPEAGRKATELFAAYAAAHPRNVQAAWLANVAAEVSGAPDDSLPKRLRLPVEAFRSAPLAAWTNEAPRLGVAATDLAGGAVMDDFDGDGRLDLVASTWDPCAPMKAYRNRGDGTFEDVAARWGLEAQLGGLNVNQADFDNDGDLDLLVLRGAWMLGDGRIRNSLLRNDLAAGKGFTDVTASAGLAEPAFPSGTAAWSDYDGDGDLDLYVGNEASPGLDFASQLFQNQGDGTFGDVTARAGVANRRYSKGTAWGDYDGDGDPDLYVSNFGDNRLYRNRGDGTFQDVAPELGVTEPERESFPTWFFDFDSDGDLDLFVGDYRQQPAQVSASYFGVEVGAGQPLLYRNDDARFTEVSRQLGLTRPAMPMGANFGDLDNDGWLDLYLGTGEPDFASLMPNQMYRFDGHRFEEVTFSGGFGHLQKGHGVAFGDLDNDGDQDLYHQVGGFYPGDDFGNALFINPGSEASWIGLLLQGTEANRFAVGAHVELVLATPGGERRLYRTVGSGGSFGASSLRLEVGLGDATAIKTVAVQWPGSRRSQSFSDLRARRYYRLIEGEARAVAIDLPRVDLQEKHGG